MTSALEAAERHLAALAANGVPHNEKPSAFHHGLITTLVAELRTATSRLSAERKGLDEDQREFQREARDIAAEARWDALREADERGTY